MAEAKAVGVHPAEFWRMTPREFWAVARGHYLAENRRLQAEVAAHWYGAGFQRYKRLPDLNKVLRGLQEAGNRPSR